MSRKNPTGHERHPLLAFGLLQLFMTLPLLRDNHLPLNLETCSISFLEDGFAGADVVEMGSGDVGAHPALALMQSNLGKCTDHSTQSQTIKDEPKNLQAWFTGNCMYSNTSNT